MADSPAAQPGDDGPSGAASGPAGRWLWARPWDLFWSILGGSVRNLGNYVILLGQTLFWLVRRPFRLRLFLEQMEFVGVGSLFIVILVATFVGLVFGLQTVEAARRIQVETYVGSAVALALTRELAPVLCAIMITARAGSAMATELGSMRVTEQIDALVTLSVNPIQYLVVPRVVASVVMVPAMTMVFDIAGMLGAYFIAVEIKGVDFGVFVENTRWFTDVGDILHGVIKASVFGLALSIIGCYQGFYASGGAKGVGQATTRAVVTSIVSILVLDYFLTDLLLPILHPRP
jgi:phospholipid/cholesterol/gamma-HCH transport system permease protein